MYFHVHQKSIDRFYCYHMYFQIVQNPTYEPKSIICAIDEKFSYKISSDKVYRVKKKVLEEW
jgi:hypothetical protein